MRRSCILALVVAMVMFSTSCNKVRKIPRGTMSKVYAEMLLADQWITSHGKKSTADTTKVYAPILAKYGYTVEDYRLSVESYMDDPKRFSKVLDKTRKILKEELDLAQAIYDAKHRADSLAKLPPPQFFLKWLKVESPDSTALSYNIFELEAKAGKPLVYIPDWIDTLYDGPVVTVRNGIGLFSDSLVVDMVLPEGFEFMEDKENNLAMEPLETEPKRVSDAKVETEIETEPETGAGQESGPGTELMLEEFMTEEEAPVSKRGTDKVQSPTSVVPVKIKE